MKVTINGTNHKNTVIFIHGNGKSSNDWNFTSKQKEIGIESHIRKTRNTVLIDLSPEDYLRPISDITNEIYEQISPLLNTKIICVCHSYAGFFGV